MRVSHLELGVVAYLDGYLEMSTVVVSVTDEVAWWEQKTVAL